jgi:hypothetical protein
MASSQSSSPSHSSQAFPQQCGNFGHQVVASSPGSEPKSNILNAPAENAIANAQSRTFRLSHHCDPEFIRSRIVIPFDPAAEAERQDRNAAVKAMEAREYQENLKVWRGIVNGMIICLVGWAIAIAWCLL